ncbi:MAG: hypothetical protein HXX08_11935 [Chloroflexi bacterium]|uniref:FecR protein domain-containing protein n=1 Tax=Candidatus Chlorohelix allophototropha TaxID=3003348 RepID=A0A8T7M2W9_9CHLR|nr:hypothetical protein [Chloroflexota bacterium]WJW65951.1 hypothetical protein OZ401_001731 [Chloroflexota bacterium L227-S17]
MSLKTAPVNVEKGNLKPKFKPQTIAWVVIFISFAIFCLLVYLVANLVSDYLSRSSQNRSAIVTVTRGPVYIARTGQGSLLVANPLDTLQPGDSILTDNQSQAVLELFDGTKLDIYSSSKVRLSESRIVTTNFVRREKQLVVEVSLNSSEDDRAGVGKVSVQFDNKDDQEYIGKPLEINCTDGASLIFEGSEDKDSYSIDLIHSTDGSSRTLINSTVTNTGNLQISAAGKTQTLAPGKRVFVDSGQPPVESNGLQDELIRNNRAFINGLDGWEVQQKDSGNLDNIFCSLFIDSEKVDDGTIYRAHTYRGQNTKDSHECSVIQELNTDVSRYQSLVLNFKLKIQTQSLSGGGEQGIEFPLFVRISYVDTQGNPYNEYFAGFYITPFDPKDNTRVAKYIVSEQVKQGEWIEFSSEDLMQRRNKPQKILSITVGSAGHDYEAYFTDLSLVGKG